MEIVGIIFLFEVEYLGLGRMLKNASDSTCTSEAILWCRFYQSFCAVWFLHFLGVKSGKAPCLVLHFVAGVKRLIS